MDKLVTELYEQMKEIEEGYVEWEKNVSERINMEPNWFFCQPYLSIYS